MSFVDLMSDDEWSEADVLNRTESMIRSHFSLSDEQILNRKISASFLGAYTMTDLDKSDLARFTEITGNAVKAGQDARSDILLLKEIKNSEDLYRQIQASEKDSELYLNLKNEIQKIPENITEWMSKRNRVVLDIDYRPEPPETIVEPEVLTQVEAQVNVEGGMSDVG